MSRPLVQRAKRYFMPITRVDKLDTTHVRLTLFCGHTVTIDDRKLVVRLRDGKREMDAAHCRRCARGEDRAKVLSKISGIDIALEKISGENDNGRR